MQSTHAVCHKHSVAGIKDKGPRSSYQFRLPVLCSGNTFRLMNLVTLC